MAFVVAFVIASVVFFGVRMCSKLVKAYESDEHLVDEEEGQYHDEASIEERPEEETPFLSVHTEEPVIQHNVPAEPTQYFYMIPQNQVVFPAEHYVLPANFGPFPQALTFEPTEQQQ